ncbi:MAG: hypothetical protein ACRBN8_32020 [Nannocystales bacterium]
MFPLVAAPAGCAWISKTLGGDRATSTAPPTPEQRRQRYVDAHPEADTAVREAILAGKLTEGMQGEQVRASLGSPVSRETITPSTPERGDAQWIFEEVAYGTQTSFDRGGSHSTRTFSGVRDTRVRFWNGAVVGVDDLGYVSRGELVASCQSGRTKSCDRVHQLDQRAASGPPAES